MVTAAFHPGFLARVLVHEERLPDENAPAVRITIGRMLYHAERAASSPTITGAVRSALPVRTRRPDVELPLLHRWIRGHVRFISDEETCLPLGRPDCSRAEVLIPPVDLLNMVRPQGDCDDFVMLAYSMLKAAGYNPQMVTVAANLRWPDEWSHVYLLVHLPGGRVIPFDASHGPIAGWEANWVKKNSRGDVMPC